VGLKKSEGKRSGLDQQERERDGKRKRKRRREERWRKDNLKRRLRVK
jgi:hypothetical protein